MATRPPSSISERLNTAQVVIENSLNTPDILEAVTAFGYDEDALTEGQALWTAAHDAVEGKTGGKGSQTDSTKQLEKVEKAATDAYQALNNVARAVFAQDKGKLAILGLKGSMARSTAGFLNQAYTLFDNAAANADIQAVLAKYGYKAAKIKSERTKIAAYDKANQAQESAKGSSQRMTRAQEKALDALDKWVAQYVKIAKVALKDDKDALEQLGILVRNSKTAAQRAAPTKAATTRNAKKA